MPPALIVWASVLAACVLGTAATVSAEVTFTVEYNDPDGLFDPYRPLLDDNILASAQRWSNLIDGAGSLQIVINPTTSSRATGRSLTSSFAFNNGSLNAFHQGAAAEVIKGVDPNGPSVPDLEINIKPDRFADVGGTLWLDPSPYTRDTATPASNRRDAMTVLIHEIGHGLAYSGWMNSTDGTYPGNFQSTYDRWKVWNGSNILFEGPESMRVNNGPTALTFANGSHVGNSAPGPSSNVLGDIMNGVRFVSGRRYDVSPSNVATLLDVGFETKVGKTRETTIDGVQFSVGWFGETWDTNLNLWITQLELATGAFGESRSFDFLGNTLQVTTEVAVVDSANESWTISITAADGGDLFDPLDSARWDGWRVDQFAVGEFNPTPDSGDGDPIDVLNFVNFDVPEAIGDWSVQSLELLSGDSTVLATDISAKAESNGVYLHREFDGDGLTIVDAPGQGAADPGVTEIRFTVGVQTFFSQMTGDYDQDGDIDQADYLAWNSAFGSDDFVADGNGDGAVDAADYVLWRDALSGSTSSAIVPEPGALALVSASFGLAVRNRRRG